MKVLNVQNSKDMSHLIGLKKEIARLERLQRAWSNAGFDRKLLYIAGAPGSGKSAIGASFLKYFSQNNADIYAMEIGTNEFTSGNGWDNVERWFQGLGSERGSILWLDEAHQICPANADVRSKSLLSILMAMGQNDGSSLSNKNIKNGECFVRPGPKDFVLLTTNYVEKMRKELRSRCFEKMVLPLYSNKECVAIFNTMAKEKGLNVENQNVASIVGNAVRGNARRIADIVDAVLVMVNSGDCNMLSEDIVRRACKEKGAYPYGVTDLGLKILLKLKLRPLEMDVACSIDTQLSEDIHSEEIKFLRLIEIGDESNPLVIKGSKNTVLITKSGINYIANLGKKGWL